MNFFFKHTPALLPKASEICIVGGGIVGVLTALELAEKRHNVVLLERGRLGWSQSSRNLGWVRQQGRARAELPIMIDAHRRWSEMERKYTAADLRFDQYGITYFGAGDDMQQTYEIYQRDLANHGVTADLVSSAQINARFPDAPVSWEIGLQTHADGRVEPQNAVTSLAQIAKELGVTLIQGCSVTDIEPSKTGNSLVHTTWGPHRSEKLLICAGAGSARLLRNIDQTLPQLCIESTVVEVVDKDATWVGSGSDGKIAFYRNQQGHIGLSLCEKFIHRVGFETARQLPHYMRGLKDHLATAQVGVPHGKHHEPQPSVVSASLSISLAKARGLIGENAQISRAWAGEIDILPDFLPVIGTLPDHPSVAVAAGFSGHGFGLAPGVAGVLAQALREEQPSHDLTPFRMSRFSDGGRLTPGPTF